MKISIFAFFLGCCLAGCAQLQRVEEKTDKNDARLRAIHSLTDNIQKTLDDLVVQQGGATGKVKADLTILLNKLESQLERIISEMDESQFRLRELEKKVDRIGGRNTAISLDSNGYPVAQAENPMMDKDNRSTDVIPGLDIEKLYLQAREDYIVSKYKLAFKGFQTVYEKDINGDYKDNALYWMGECRYKQNQLIEAAEYYHRCINEFPKGNKICSAYFKLGMVYDKQKNALERDRIWKILITECSGSNEAHRAKEIMKK